MSPRPNKVTDEDIFMAAQRAMSQRGPQDLTLAHIAEEAGVTPGRLVQRFGSKRELLLALAARFGGGAPEIFAALRRAHHSPLAALRAYVEGMAGLAVTPDALARNLAYLQIDLTDPALREHLVAHARATRREIEALVRAALAAGELAPLTSVATLARAVETAISGSLMTWACYQEGAVAPWLRRDLDTVLRPYLTGGTHRRVAGTRKAPRSSRVSKSRTSSTSRR